MKKKLNFWLFGLFIVMSLLSLSNISIYAADDGNGNTGKTEDYTIVDYKVKRFGDDYNEKDYNNIDRLCTASKKGTKTVDGSNSGNIEIDNICDTNDNTVHIYPAWKMVAGFAPTIDKNDNKVEHKKKLNDYNSYLFKNSRSTWVEYSSQVENDETGKTNSYSVTEWSNSDYDDKSIHYTMVYLHKTTKGFDLYRNYRYQQFYQPGLDGNLTEDVSINSDGYYLTHNNGAFMASNTQLAYSPVPHILGTEGIYDMAIAIMDETTGAPVPILVEGGKNTGLGYVKTEKRTLNEEHFCLLHITFAIASFGY